MQCAVCSLQCAVHTIPGPQVCRVSGVSGHLCQTAGDLPEGLGPAGGRVGHHRHVVAHVTEVLRQGDTSVDGRLPDDHICDIDDDDDDDIDDAEQ